LKFPNSAQALILVSTILIPPHALAGRVHLDVPVSLTISAECSISGSPLTFSNYSFDSGATANAYVEVTCTRETPFEIQFGTHTLVINIDPNAFAIVPAMPPGWTNSSNGFTGTLRLNHRGNTGHPEIPKANSVEYAIYEDNSYTKPLGSLMNGGYVYTGIGDGNKQRYGYVGRIAPGQHLAAGHYEDTFHVQVEY